MRERLLIALIILVLIAMPVVAFVGEINAEQGLQRSSRPGFFGRYTQLNIPARSDLATPSDEGVWSPPN